MRKILSSIAKTNIVTCEDKCLYPTFVDIQTLINAIVKINTFKDKDICLQIIFENKLLLKHQNNHISAIVKSHTKMSSKCRFAQ